MATQINPPRGMRDFLPQEKSKREDLLGKIKKSYLTRGFQEIETPVVEELSRLVSGQGGDNEKLVFKIQKRGEEFDSALSAGNELSDLGLRFDLTVPLTRFYASNHSKLPKVFKAIQTGPVFRAERPQKGRYRQFIQCDIDIIGDASLLAELELLSASLSALEQIGLVGAVIRVNSRKLLTNNISSLGINSEDSMAAMITIDKLDKVGIQGVAEELQEKFGTEVADKAKAWLEGLDSSLVPEELQPIWDGMGETAASLRFDPTLVRGMGYYTGTIFEIEHPGSTGSIGGGGRYDGMIGKHLGSEVPAVGISLGIERIVELVPASPNTTKSIVLVFDSGQEAAALEMQAQLIAEGYLIRLELRQKNMKALLESMVEAGFTSFAFLPIGVTDLRDLDVKPLGN
jgi:histidyl-tRNA synthetase